MKITVTLTIELEPEHMAPVKVHQLRYLLCDAFAEFQNPRRNAVAYVDTRYPEQDGYQWVQREEKVAEVEARVYLAELFRVAALHAEPVVTDTNGED